MRVDYITPPRAVLKNHNKSQKSRKMENPIVLDLERVDLHNEHIWYAYYIFFIVPLDLCFSSSCKKMY
jgi:hypothetical protein